MRKSTRLEGVPLHAKLQDAQVESIDTIADTTSIVIWLRTDQGHRLRLYVDDPVGYLDQP